MSIGYQSYRAINGKGTTINQGCYVTELHIIRATVQQYEKSGGVSMVGQTKAEVTA